MRDFRQCVASGVPFFVALVDGGVAGYVIARHVAYEGEILNLGVHPERRRAGVARALVEHVLRALGALGVESVYLEVRESNAAARRLYQGLGFREVGRRRGYYRRPMEDALLLRAAIAPGEGDA